MRTECSRNEDSVPENAIQGWVFDRRTDESRFLASFIAAELQNNKNLCPTDFVILARNWVDKVEDRIKLEFEARGLKVRNESRRIGDIVIQDLMKEQAYLMLLATTKLAVNVRGGQPYQDCLNTFAALEGMDLDSDKEYSKAQARVKKLVSNLQDLIKKKSPTEIEGKDIVDLMIDHIGFDKLQRTYQDYRDASRLNSVIEGFTKFFDECRLEAITWSDCITNMEGSDSVRLMTIHKSKGLEYHTVFFVEFNDDSFWKNDDDVNVFFVALSRARERVYFSHCRDSKGFANIKPLIDRLKIAKVSFVKPEL